MQKITITRLADIRKGDIIILKHRIPVTAVIKEPCDTLRKYKVLAVYQSYVLCESMNGYPHKESFSYIQLQEEKAKIYRQ